MRKLVCLFCLLAAFPAWAETLVAAATIRAKTLIGPEHLTIVPDAIPGGLRDPSEVIGLEARVAIYAGRPIRSTDLGPPAVVDRNQIVTLVFHRGGLAIQTGGRVLDRGASGDTVRALNLASRSTITGILDDAGRIHVGTTPGLQGSR